MTIDDLIKKLISIGSDEVFSLLPELIGSSQEHRSGQFMRQSPKFWYEIGVTLSRKENIALIKALTVAEREVPSMKAGSVSPVIWLYKHICQRFPGEYTELEEWILKETDNHYLPWGTFNHGAQSLEEFRRFSSEWAQKREGRQFAEEQRRIEALKRKSQKATHNLMGAIKRGDIKAIIALRHRGADVNAKDESGKSLLQLAHETGDAEVVEAVTMILKKDE